MTIGAQESEASWADLVRKLNERGLEARTRRQRQYLDMSLLKFEEENRQANAA